MTACKPSAAAGEVQFRCLTPRDAARLRSLRHRAIQECAPLFGTPPEIELARGTEYYRLRLVQERRNPLRPILGGWVEDDLICMAGLRRRRTAAGPVGLITSMYVIPSWRGCGIGEQLLEQAMDRIRSGWALSRFQMNVEVDNERALGLYLKHGFQVIRREENAFTIDGVPHAVFLLECKDEPG